MSHNENENEINANADKIITVKGDKVKYAIEHPEYSANTIHEFLKDAHTLMASLKNLYEEHVDVLCIVGLKVKFEITSTDTEGNSETIMEEEFGIDPLKTAMEIEQ